MDKLAKRLREDAEQINATISPELDERINASLRAVTPAKPEAPVRRGHSWVFWFASSLTGAAAAFALIAILNVREDVAPAETMVADGEPGPTPAVPVFDLHAETRCLMNMLLNTGHTLVTRPDIPETLKH